MGGYWNQATVDSEGGSRPHLATQKCYQGLRSGAGTSVCDFPERSPRRKDGMDGSAGMGRTSDMGSPETCQSYNHFTKPSSRSTLIIVLWQAPHSGEALEST